MVVFCPSADFAYIHTCIIDFVSTLEEIEELLDPRKFYRANRQFIVNIDAIQCNAARKSETDINTQISIENGSGYKQGKSPGI